MKPRTSMLSIHGPVGNERQAVVCWESDSGGVVVSAAIVIEVNLPAWGVSVVTPLPTRICAWGRRLSGLSTSRSRVPVPDFARCYSYGYSDSHVPTACIRGTHQGSDDDVKRRAAGRLLATIAGSTLILGACGLTGDDSSPT